MNAGTNIPVVNNRQNPTTKLPKFRPGLSLKEREYDRIIFALRYDSAFLTQRDRWFLADFLETNGEQDMPRRSWLTIMSDYEYGSKPTGFVAVDQ
jgi:hypothetical protein